LSNIFWGNFGISICDKERERVGNLPWAKGGRGSGQGETQEVGEKEEEEGV